MKGESRKQQIRESAHRKIQLLERRYLDAARYLSPGHPQLRTLLTHIGAARGELRHLLQ